MANLLIIDDDTALSMSIRRLFTDEGHRVNVAATLGEGLRQAEMIPYDVVFLDVRLPDGNGLDSLPRLHDAASEPEIVILTGHADMESAAMALNNNAWDYLKKPINSQSLVRTLESALTYRESKHNGRRPPRALRHEIIGGSSPIRECLELLGKAAETRANILITGETGTGKELFARAIHANSDRADAHFVVVDCGALPETLMESLLFGHTKGAFTGADRAEEGLVKRADGGTLFLDEIGELTLSAQKSLLRVLQERRYHPVGSSVEVESDFRLVAATNRDLEAEARAGNFREDLLFRLRSVTILLPPLRHRRDDIQPLAEHYVRRLCKSYNIPMKEFSPDFFKVLTQWDWPGNVRELNSALEWVMAQAYHESILFPRHLPPEIRLRAAEIRENLSDGGGASECGPAPDPGDAESLGNAPGPDGKLICMLKWKEFRRAHLNEGEKIYLRHLIHQVEGNINEAAAVSGLSKPRIYELLRKHGLSAR